MIEPRSRSRFGRAVSLWSPVTRYGAAIAAILVTTGVIALINSEWAFFAPFTIENPGTLFIATITLVALLIGAGPALVAAATSMFVVFLAFSRYERFERAVILVATMLIIIGLAEWQRRARDAAERAQAKFVAIMESMRDAVMVVDMAGRATDVNRAAVAMLGAADYTDALAKVTHCHANGTPATNEHALLKRALAGEEAPQEDVSIPDAPDGPRIVSAVASPMRDGRGGIIGAVSVSRDMTDRLNQMREREQLHILVEERRQFAQAVFDTVPVALAVIDTEAMTISAANPAYVEATPEPYRSRGVNGHTLADVLPHATGNGFISQLRTTSQTGTPFEVSATGYEHPTRGTTYWNETMIPLTMTDPAACHVLYIAADVTKEVEARQRIAALAREAAERAAELEAIITNMPDGVAIYTSDGRLLQMNTMGQQIVGTAPQPGEAAAETVERSAFRYPDGRVIPFDDLPLSRALRGESVSRYELISHTPHGDIHLLSSSAPIHDVTGEITRAVVMFTDNTQRKHIEQERERLLREVEEGHRLAQTVIDSAPTGIVVFRADPGFTVRLANDHFLPLVQERWRSAGVVGIPLATFLPRAEESGVAPIFRRVAETGNPVSLSEFEYEGTDGRIIFYDWSLVPLREGGDDVTGLILLITDVTDRVQSRQRIEELAWDAAQRASELETVIASIADGVMVTDAEGRIVLENTASRRLNGRTQSAVSFDLEAQVTAQGMRDPGGVPIPPNDLPLGRAVRGEIVAEQVVIVRRTDTGEDRFLMCSSAPVRADSGAISGAVAVFRDITEMKQLDQMKDDFVSIAAHELRTPLTAIKGYAELLDRRLRLQGGRESDLRSLGVIRKQTERLADLVNEMLDVSRIEAGRLQLNREPFDLSTLVGEVVNNMRISSEAHHLSLTAEPGIEVNGDTARIEQVLLNLIANAMTYSPAGGNVDVRVWREDGTALVSVRDQGVGIATDELPQLFDRFYRAPRAGVMRSGGMGLGLFICQEIVARHDGTIWVESAEGVGSIFTFSLPLAGKE